MPLIILTGYPCSGKTHRAAQLYTDFQARIKASLTDATITKTITTIVPSHHSLLDPSTSDLSVETSHNNVSTGPTPPPDSKSNPRDQIYGSAPLEKTARAEEFSAIKRALGKNNIVIADGLNYIKGFRYQLWCEAKAAGTRCVVVHVGAREDEVRRWNRGRLQAWGWHDIDQNEEDREKSEHRRDMTGKDVLGDLVPEAHTAIYGDRVVDFDEGRRSRTSSMGSMSDESIKAQVDEDEAQRQQNRKAKDSDTMTLKSLYISDHHNTLARESPDVQDQKVSGFNVQDTMPVNNTPTQQNRDIDSLPSLPTPMSALPYSSSTLKALIMRYEPPSPFTRWDTPLFTVPSSDPHPPYAAIWSAIFPSPAKPLSKKARSQLPPPSQNLNPQEHNTTSKEAPEEVKRHAATVLPRATGSEALQTLENATGDVVKSLLAAARSAGLAEGEGGSLTFTVASGTQQQQQQEKDQSPITPQSNGTEQEIKLPVGLILSQPVLQRLRRKYTQIQRGGIAHGVGYVSGRQEVIQGFVAFLEAEWEG